jgi:hypothetical protein
LFCAVNSAAVIPNLVSGIGEVSNQEAANSGLLPDPVAVTMRGPNPCFAIASNRLEGSGVHSEVLLFGRQLCPLDHHCRVAPIAAIAGRTSHRNGPIASRSPSIELLLVTVVRSCQPTVSSTMVYAL